MSITDERLAELIWFYSTSGSSDSWTSERMTATETALRELASLREQMKWRPIETAPKDGKFLVLADHGLPWPACAKDGIIRSNAHGVVNEPKDRHSLTVTHWMPLPPAPDAGEKPT